MLARAINHPDIILCDDESVIYLNSIFTGICGTALEIKRTIEYLHSMFTIGTISATDFKEYFKKMGDLGLLYYRYPPKDTKDIIVSDILLDFMDKTSSAYNNYAGL
ncbi:MAG: hypothetical protein ACE5KT_07760 [Methanosarcinales archaeon]